MANARTAANHTVVYYRALRAKNSTASERQMSPSHCVDLKTFHLRWCPGSAALGHPDADSAGPLRRLSVESTPTAARRTRRIV